MSDLAPHPVPGTPASLTLDGTWLVHVYGQVRGDRASLALMLRRTGLPRAAALLAGDLDRPGVPRLSVDDQGRVVLGIFDQVQALVAPRTLAQDRWETVVVRYDRSAGRVALSIGGEVVEAAIRAEVGIDLDTITIGGPHLLPGLGAFVGALAGLRIADRWWTDQEAADPFALAVDSSTTGWWSMETMEPGHLPGRWRLPSCMDARAQAANAIRLDSVDGGGGSMGTLGALVLAAGSAQPEPVATIDGDVPRRLGIEDVRRASFSDAPAWSWEAALPTGNGSHGAMLLGRPEDEVVVLNRAGLFLPLHPPIDPPRQAELLPDIRRDLHEGRFQAAADRVVAKSHQDGYTDEKRWTDPFIPAAFLRIRQPAAGPLRAYVRGTDYRDGTVVAAWRDGRGDHRRRLIAARDRDVVVLDLEAPPGGLTCHIELVHHDPEAALDGERPVVELGSTNRYHTGDLLVCRQAYARTWPGSIRAAITVARVVPRGGSLAGAGAWDLTAADGALVLVRTAIERDGDDAEALIAALSAGLRALPVDVSTLWAGHRAVHQPLMDACRLDLGGTAAAHARTGVRLFAEAKVGAADPALLEKTFHACRHLAVCSSGPTHPPTLQGIWGGSWRPSWSGDYTQNGNLQTAVAGHLAGGLAEALEGFFAYQESLLPHYRHNAQVLYGARGIQVPSRTSTHGLLNHFDGTWPMTFWTAGAAWNARFFFDHWLHTGDRAFLVVRALPFLREVAAFYEDFLAGEGVARFMPSYSPENDSPATGSQSTVDAAMDVGAARQLLEDLLSLANEGLITADEQARWRRLRDRLPPFRIGEGGVLAEWGDPRLTERHEHRHASQLYAFYDGLPAWAEGDRRLLDAACATVRARMVHRRAAGGGIMAFGMVQLGCAAASLGMAEDAGDIVDWLANRFFFPESFVTTHNPRHVLNVDIAGGLPRLMLLCLADSRPGLIRLLSALPSSWPSGRVEGLHCRAQVVIRHLAWDPRGVEVEFLSPVTQTVQVQVAARAPQMLKLMAGIPLRLVIARSAAAA